jgi:hypothetical protein
MALKSMKRKKKSKKELEEENSPIGIDEPDYPWGLEVNLENESLEQLGLGAGDFKIGEGKNLTAKVRVDHISSNKRRNGKNRDSVRMQITEMDLEGAKEESKSDFAKFQEQQDSGHDVL